MHGGVRACGGLGPRLEADGKEKEALDSYIQSYKTDKPDLAKFILVESLYRKLNGSTEGSRSRHRHEQDDGLNDAVLRNSQHIGGHRRGTDARTRCGPTRRTGGD